MYQLSSTDQCACRWCGRNI